MAGTIGKRENFISRQRNVGDMERITLWPMGQRQMMFEAWTKVVAVRMEKKRTYLGDEIEEEETGRTEEQSVGADERWEKEPKVAILVVWRGS